MSAIKSFVRDLPLQSGHLFRNASLVYKTYGELNEDRSNAILFPTRFGGTHEQNEFLIGSNMALNPERYFIVVPNMFGNSVSSSPANTPHPLGQGRFPDVTIFDNVRAQHSLLIEELGIETLEAVVGWSMGAQQALQWGCLYPDMVQRLACICGTAKTAEHNRVFLESIRAAIVADQHFQEGFYEGASVPRLGLRAVGRIYAGWAYSQDWYRKQLYKVLGFISLDDFLLGYWDALFEKRDANSIMAMTWTWVHNDISANDIFQGDLAAALRAIHARTILMPCNKDLYFRKEDNEIEMKHLPNAELIEIHSDWGHMCGSGQSAEDTAFIDAALKKLLT